KEHRFRCSLSSASCLPCACVRFQRTDGKFDVFWDDRQKAALIPGDSVSSHAEPFRQFALRETEEEPSFPKLPAGQAGARLPQGAIAVNDLPGFGPERISFGGRTGPRKRESSTGTS